MLELLMQPPSEGSAAGRFYTEAAPGLEWRQLAVVAADAATGVGGGGSGGWTAVKADEQRGAALGIDDAKFFDDLLFEPLVQPAIQKAEDDALLLMLGGGSEASLFDSGTEEFLHQYLLKDLASLPVAMEGELLPEDQGDDDCAELLSSSPASFAPTTSPGSMPPTSPAPSAASSSRSSAYPPRSSSGSGSVSGGRVDKKKEANREAAYRYRMKQRLGDTALDQRRSALQSRADELAGGVGRAEEELKFLAQMCRQIFSSRRQLLLAANGSSRLGSQLA